MTVSPWVAAHAAHIPAGGVVLDVACGGGRHGRFFLERGHPVVLVDIDVRGVADLAGRPGVEIVAADLEGGGWPFGDRRFAGLVVTNYLWRPLLPALVAATEGALIYETFAVGNERFGRPRNPDFLLREGELLDAVRGALEVCAYEHVEIPETAVKQRICARRA